MSVQWTAEQQKVIELRNRNILVSAAAGSGKTAVLVERIIGILTDAEHPVDVDRLLIVTFTEAAAAEMKERIRTAIEAALEQDPGNQHLQRQATLIHSAQITTIHSFCLSVIREHFHVIDLDPGFRIAEEGELKLLKQDVLEQLLEDCYLDEWQEFLEVVEKLGTGRTDKKLEGLILQLYEYSRSYPQPERWLARCVEQYAVCREYLEQTEGQAEEPAEKPAGKPAGEPAIFQITVQLVKQLLSDLIGMAEEGIRLCETADGPYMYAAMLESDRDQMERIRRTGTFEEMYACLASLKWKTLSRKSDESVSESRKEEVKALREQVKNAVKELKETYFYEEPDQLYRDMADACGTMEVLAELVERFARAFAEEKQKKSLIDFGDMEQFALRILTEETEGELVPSVTAREYQEQFCEVMIDEYQDSNLIQEAILTSVSTVSRGQNNIFMVGDVKQSIYRFRLSRPELFMEKYDAYSTEDSDTQRIDLHRNFRSRVEVLDGVNAVFRRIMRRELGGIQYDDDAALYPGASFEADVDETGKSRQIMELVLVNPDLRPDAVMGDEEIFLPEPQETADSGRELESRVIARRIREMVGRANVTDKKTGHMRKAEYRDIVILSRSAKGWTDVLSAVLAEEGVPAYAASKEGYFETYEVSVLLDYLQLLDNQRQDLPLAAVLTSPFAGLTAQEMAEIRLAAGAGSFYQAAEAYAAESIRPDTEAERTESISGNPEDQGDKAAPEIRERLQKKLQSFYAQLTRFREMIPYTGIHDLLHIILEETGYGLYISAMPGGSQRQANVEMLVEKAAAFEGTSYKGLFNFVRYIEQLQEYNVDYGEANITEEQADAVRIMTIHKSKGLEFPIVFLAGMGKHFNTADLSGSIIPHPEWGVGLDVVDLERRTRTPAFLKKMIQQQVRLENLGEELRVLYVALTRAKEKLIMVGQIKNKQIDQMSFVYRQLRENPESVEAEGERTFYQLTEASSYLDWVLPVLLREGAPVEIRLSGKQDIRREEAVVRQGEAIARDVLEHWDTGRVYEEPLRRHLQEQFNYRYPYAEEQKRKLKFTVSELKKRAYLQEEGGECTYEEPEIIPLIPQFLQEETELTGASRGSAYHKFLELLDFTVEYEGVTLSKEIRRLQKDGKLSKEMADCIRIPAILKFLQSSAGQRMHRAALQGKLFKEQPFVLGVDAAEIYPDATGEETILVQGIIDVYFEEEGELVVLDYKTDRVRTAGELRERYHAQLEYYAQALDQLLEKPVKEKLIYSFTLEEEIIL